MSEKMTFNQINKQASSAYMNRSGADPTVLVERKSGRITVGRLDADTKNVHFSEDGQDFIEPSVSMELLSDERQAQLAEKLAETPLRDNEAPAVIEKRAELIEVPDWIKRELGDSALKTPGMATEAPAVGSPNVEQAAADPLDALSDNVKAEVMEYRRAVQNKREAQRAKNFALAAEDGRAMYRVEQRLSLEAKAFLGL